MNQIDMLGRKALAFGCSVAYEEPMSRHTTFKIGGPADLFVTAHNVAMLSDFLREAKEMDVRVLMIGNGSNLLVSDEGVPRRCRIFGRCVLRHPPARRNGACMRGGRFPGRPL